MITIFGTKFKIILSIIFAVFLSYFLSVMFQPKLNKTIPVQPISLKVDLIQNSDNSLTTKSISIEQDYAQDYQTDFESNYYEIKIKKGNEVLFTGKTVKSYVIIKENFGNEGIEGESDEKPLENFTLYLPYYSDATEVIITDDTGTETLHENLSTFKLIAPNKMKESCGDGICSDNENLLMCYSDCSASMKTFWNK